MERYLDEHDNEERRARHQTEEVRHQTEEVRHQGMVLAPNKTEADKFCGIYNKYHKDEKCKVFVSGTPKRIYQDFIHKKIRVLVIVRRLLEGFDHKFVSVLGVICKINPASQVLFSHFVGRAVRRIYRKDPVKAHIVTHQYFNLRKNYEEFEQLAKEDPQGDMVTIYVLDDSLIKEAEDIKQFLESDYTIQMCPHTLDQYFLQNNSTSVLAAYQHYTQCSKVPCRVSNMTTDIIGIRPFSDLVKLMPRSLPELSDAVEFEDELPVKLSQLSGEYQMEVSAMLCQLSEEFQKKLTKLQQHYKMEVSTELHQLSLEECQKDISAKLNHFSGKCQKELSDKLNQLSEQYQEKLQPAQKKFSAAKPHQLSEEDQKKISAELQQLSEISQKELIANLHKLSKDCQNEFSTKLLQLTEEYQRKFTIKLPEDSVEELHAELSQLTTLTKSETSSDPASVQEVEQLPDTGPTTSADVIVILGHSGVFSCGPFETEELLVALTTKLDPTVIAFISCCGGNKRYGPIYKMSHLLTSKCLVGFYQRRVYIEELCETSLVIGLRNYLYLQCELTKSVKGETDEKRRLAAIQAFACAKLSLKNDPTVFISDCNEQNLTEIFCEAIDGKIPLSTLQLAMYHRIVVDSNMCPINISMKSVDVEELDKNCISEIRKHRIHELVPLILELRLLKLYNKPLDLIKTGNPSSWKEVDHLQFLLAMLCGYWGKNTLTVIREWATFHLMEMMGECNKMDDDKLKHGADIHKYKLCCACYALLCEHNFVRFVEPGKDRCGIIAYTRFFGPNIIVPGSVWYESGDDMYRITSDGYISGTKCVIRTNILPTPNGPYPNKGELLWEELFDNCRDMNDCADMWNGRSTQWEIISALRVGRAYKYRQLDFQLAMATLNEFLKPSVTVRQCYGIMEFINRTNRYRGTMKCFPQQHFPDNEYTMYEMRVFMNTDFINDALIRLFKNEGIGSNDIDSKAREHRANWVRMLGCRFVFCALNNPGGLNNKTGTLFYTDNHYGHNLINFGHYTHDLLQVLKRIQDCSYTQYKERCSRYIERNPKKSVEQKKRSLCIPCHDKMKKRNFVFDHQALTDINGSHCNNSNGLQYVTCYNFIKCYQDISVLVKIKSLCYHCKYDLQKFMIRERAGHLFPFKRLGSLTLITTGGPTTIRLLTI